MTSYLFNLLEKNYKELKKKKIPKRIGYSNTENLIKIKTSTDHVDHIEMILTESLSDYDFVKSRFSFPSLKNYLEQNKGKYDTVTILNLTGNNLSNRQNLKLFIDEILPLIPICKYINLKFNKYDNECWDVLIDLLKMDRIEFLNVSGNLLANISSKKEFSELDINLHKKLIWIFDHWLSSETWKNCLDHDRYNSVINSTHLNFYKKYK
eukprot:TRINITY_DN5447_c0_g1_i2.p1 TRINITY_DN5447_c0_g1~~TRINITY_DN5447_c0_g1_i2.p1  ORF type:complete len:209 (-),score=44.83 TRINITY_DN5447_c0_g1_i2:16-642(-)